MRKLLILIVVLLVGLLALTAAFFNYTEVDAAVRGSLRDLVPQTWQERLRPLRAPIIIDFSPRWEATDVSPHAPVSLTFLTPMNAASTEANVTIGFDTPSATQPKEPHVAGTFTWEDPQTLTFTPAEAWPLDTQITVTVGRGARSRLGRRMERPFTFRFTTVGPPRVVETEPAQEAQYAFLDPYAEGRVVLTFNRLMDHASVESRLRITPEPFNLQMEWLGNQLLIGGAFEPSTTYRVTLLSGAVDAAYGLAIEEDLSWAFTTTQRYPYLAIVGVGRFGLIEADQPAQLTLSMVNVSRVDLALYRIDVPTYIQMIGFSYDDWRWYEPEGEPLESWVIEPQAPLDQEVQRPLDLDPLPPGLYYLMATSPERAGDSQVLVVSRSALTLKHTTDQVLVWATELADGSPIADLSLTVYDEEGQALTTGRTDGDGIFFADLPTTTGSLHVVAEREGDPSTGSGYDVAVVSDLWQDGIEPWRFRGVLWQWEMRPQRYRVFLYTDRPLYRPGQRVHFKGIVRRDDDGRYEQPPAGTPVQIKVANWRGNVLYEKALETTPFGSISDDFPLSSEVGLGEYFIQATVDGEEYRTTFRIEEYRKPEYSVTVQFDRDSYINGDTIQATVNASYFFGAPAAQAQVRWTLYANDYWFTWPGGELDFGGFPEVRYWGYGREVASGEGLTDEEGNLSLSLPADISREERSQIFTLEASVTDPAQQPVSGLATALVHRGTFYIGLRPESYVAAKGQETAFLVQTVDTGGQPRGGVDLTYTLFGVTWRSWRDPDGRWRWGEERLEVASGGLTTDEEGRGRIPFTPPHGGSYELKAQGQDERGNRVLGTSWLWVADPEEMVGWRFEDHDRIELVADKRRYQPGETARILVQSPYQRARALITVERGRIISHRLMDLESNSAIIEVTIEPDYYPNVYVSTVLIPQGGPPSFKVGYAELRVESQEKLLSVSVTADRERYEPREEATYTIETRDAQGEPVSAEVSLGVVDAALYALAGGRVPDIVEGFYGRRLLAVRTAGSLTIHVERVNVRRDYGGGGGPGEEQPRRLFPDVAYWNPTIVTDEQGRAQVSFALPDNLTTWRATALAVTADTRVGSAQEEVITTKDLILRPVLPRFLTVGDEAVLGAVVHNYTGETVAAEVSLSATNLELPTETLTRTGIIGPGQALRVDWPVKVTKALSTTITMWARTPVADDGVEITLPILPFGEKVVQADAGEVEDLTIRTVNVPPEAEFATLNVDTAPSLAAGLIEGLEYLTGYPYGCVEQTMSRFLPDVLVAQTMAKLGLRNPRLEEELPKQVEEGLQRLYRFQHYDGGWGWWEADETGAYQTAYVVYGLNEAKLAGFEVNEEVLARGAEALRRPLVETENLNLKAYIIYVLTKYGEGDISLARSLLDRQAQLDLYARAYLALALHLSGDDVSARALVDDLASKSIETAATAHWEERERDWQMMSSDGRTTALVLQALLALDPENPLIPKAVRWLMRNRLGGYWRTTQETAATIIALADYLAVSGELEADYRYRVYVNGEPLGEEVVTRENVAEHREFVVTDLVAGDNEIKIVKVACSHPGQEGLGTDPFTNGVRACKEGAGRLYFATTLRYYLERDRIEADRSSGGPAVRREYLHPETGEPLTEVRVGDLIRVRLTVDLPRDMWYVIVEDPLPAGAEAVNFTLATSGLRGGQFEVYWSHPELRDEKAVFFTTRLWEGTHEYTYLIRATTAGRFRALPAEVTPMYEPEVWGRSDSAVFEIKP